MTAVVVVFALAFVQGCLGPGPAKRGPVAPQTRVFVKRASLFTLHHRRDGVALECVAQEARASVVRMTADSIILREVRAGNGPTSGDCRIAGEAIVLRADVPGIEVRPEQFSPLRSLGMVAISATVTVLVMFFLWARSSGGGS